MATKNTNPVDKNGRTIEKGQRIIWRGDTGTVHTEPYISPSRGTWETEIALDGGGRLETVRTNTLVSNDERTIRSTRQEYEDLMKQGRTEEAQRVLAWHDAALLRLKA